MSGCMDVWMDSRSLCHPRAGSYIQAGLTLSTLPHSEGEGDGDQQQWTSSSGRSNGRIGIRINQS